MIGGVVGVVAPEFSAGAGGYVTALTGSTTAGAVATGATFSALGAATGATVAIGTNLASGQPALDDVRHSALIGAAAPLLSGEAALVGVGAAARVGLPTLADAALSAQTGVFGALGAAADAGVNRSGEFAPRQPTVAQPSPSTPLK